MRSIGIVIIMVMLAAALSAQPDTGWRPGWSQHGQSPHHKKMAANLENLRLLKLLETVELSEEQSERFIPLFHGYRSDMKELFEQRRELIHRLAELVKGDASDREMEEGIDHLIDLKAKMESRQEKFIDECGTVLSTKQLARLVIFQERFEREVLESLREFRRHGPRDVDNKR
jgi:hypothetical protein